MRKKLASLFFMASILVEASCISTLSLEEKIGQMLIVHFHGTSLNAEARTYIEKLHVGGFVYYNWSNPFSAYEEVKALNHSLQELARTAKQNIPLFIAVDQEGGRVIRLKEGFTSFPSPQEIATHYDASYAKASAYITGLELRCAGVNTNFAPVVDINNNPLNPIIGSRSFSNDPLTVTEFAKASLEGYFDAGILGVLKHFPGHGDVTIDSHISLPIVNKTLKELEECELYPYKNLVSHTDMIMTAHILLPALDPTFCATLSKPILQNLLRKSLGFQGLIISDSLIMDGLLKQAYSIEETAILAVEAGCDILILGGKLLHKQSNNELSEQDILHIHQTLVQAVQSGRISESRIDESVQKILETKEKYHF